MPESVVRRAILVSLLGAILLAQPHAVARSQGARVPGGAAGGIDTINPSCAWQGQKVTITGHGLGARNVRIAVDGVPARVVTATGNMAAFIVPAGASLGAVAVTATNPGDREPDDRNGHVRFDERRDTASIAFKICDLLTPDSWGGEWQITNTYRSVATNSVTDIDNYTSFIRTGEPFGLQPAVNAGTCAGRVADAHLEVQCAGQTTAAGCTLGTSAQVAVDRTGDAIAGSGSVSVVVAGACGPLTTTGRTIQITGSRINLFQDPGGPPTTLLQSFVPFASLIGAGR